MSKFRYLYNVAFFHSCGKGCSQIIRNSKIDSLEKFKEMRRYIEKVNNLEEVAIINYQLITKKFKVGEDNFTNIDKQK